MGVQRRACTTGVLGSSAGGRPLGVKVIELINKAPLTIDNGGNGATLPNATLMASYFIIMTARTTALPASSSLLDKA
jgi:hypothetical protein